MTASRLRWCRPAQSTLHQRPRARTSPSVEATPAGTTSVAQPKLDGCGGGGSLDSTNNSFPSSGSSGR
ncbi:hypothetical protein ACFXO9_16145 [Nocardia tengchongensis]|uniref:hypothetical protein n=1 Tax=Nocardia tengchongensis TaxID=2055889 RepID=UPI003693BC73